MCVEDPAFPKHPGTVRSSPTTCVGPPTLVVKVVQAAQSSWVHKSHLFGSPGPCTIFFFVNKNANSPHIFTSVSSEDLTNTVCQCACRDQSSCVAMTLEPHIKIYLSICIYIYKII